MSMECGEVGCLNRVGEFSEFCSRIPKKNPLIPIAMGGGAGGEWERKGWGDLVVF